MSFVDPFAGALGVHPPRQNAAVFDVDVATPLTANGGGHFINVAGVNGAITIEIHKTGTGTCNFTLQETLDAASQATASSLLCNTRYAVIGSSGALSIVAGNTAIAGETQTTWVVVLDGFPTQQVQINGVSGSVSVTTRVYLCAQ